MATPEQAAATQLKNIQARTGKSLDTLYAMVAGCGLEKVSAQRQWLMQTTGLGYGDAHAIVLRARQARDAGRSGPDSEDPLVSIYAGGKAGLRPLHEALIAQIAGFGSFETAPKKAYVSLRRRKQFAMLGPATQKAIEIGLNAKTLPADPRLKSMPPGSMCQAVTRIECAGEIDAALLGWLKTCFDEAG